MKLPKLPILFLLAAAMVFLPALAEAAAKKPAPKKERRHGTPTTISAVSATSITTKAKDGSHTYSIGTSTEITYQGQTVAVSELKPGMSVDVTADSLNPSAAERIAADIAPPVPKETPKKK